jgi:hypothetical protein
MADGKILCQFEFNHRCHQRPESDWRDAISKLPHYAFCDSEDFKERTGYTCGIFLFIEDVKEFAQAEYQRGRQDAFKDELMTATEVDIVGREEERSAAIRNLELQNKRLLENNRALQAKLRELQDNVK